MAPRERKKLSERIDYGGAARRAARRSLEDRMDTTRFRRDYTPRGEHPLERIMADTSAANVREKSGLYDIVKNLPPVKDASDMVGDLLVDPIKKGIAGFRFPKLPSWMAADAISDAWDEAQEARRDDKKWTLGGDPLDIDRGSSAYTWLLDDIIQPEYRDDFRREVGKNNLHWTELNKYAGDKSAGLAKQINIRNASDAGIAGTDTGTEFINEVTTKRPGDTEQINATIDRFLSPTATDMDRLYYQSRPELAAKLAAAATAEKYAAPFDETVAIENIPEEGWDEQFLFPEAAPPFLGGNMIPPIIPEDRVRATDRPWEDEELWPMAPAGGDWPNYRPPGVPAEAPPPFLGTVEKENVEEEEFIPRGLEELVMDQYGVDALGVPREREWPTYGPPGRDRSWYEKYMAPWFNTDYDYFNE